MDCIESLNDGWVTIVIIWAVVSWINNALKRIAQQQKRVQRERAEDSEPSERQAPATEYRRARVPARDAPAPLPVTYEDESSPARSSGGTTAEAFLDSALEALGIEIPDEVKEKWRAEVRGKEIPKVTPVVRNISFAADWDVVEEMPEEVVDEEVPRAPAVPRRSRALPPSPPHFDLGRLDAGTVRDAAILSAALNRR